jgi:TolB protein
MTTSSTERVGNITRNPAAVDDDPDWSPDGKTIAFTSHLVTDGSDNHVTAEIYVINADGSGTPTRLTSNAEEERSPNWSPDGARILFACRRGAPVAGGPFPSFELCVINADGSHLTRLTNNAVAELTPTWSPDGSQIVFHRRVAGPGSFQLFVMNSDGTGERQLTFPPGINAFAHWGQIPDRSER